MPQDINTMKFCNKCIMNVFPSRSKFNIKFFLAFAIVIFPIVFTINIIFFFEISWLLNLIFFLYGFMIINPYVLYYSFKKKNYCPNCYQQVIEKNLEYQPFGDKQSELISSIAPSIKSIGKIRKNTSLDLFCPFCGDRLKKGWKFCKSCGKKNPIANFSKREKLEK